jgi:maleamate amidohydrolase
LHQLNASRRKADGEARLNPRAVLQAVAGARVHPEGRPADDHQGRPEAETPRDKPDKFAACRRGEIEYDVNLYAQGGQRMSSIDPARTALIVMHYQTDILRLFPSVAPSLLANTRRLCDAARAASVGVFFVNLRFGPGYPEVSRLNKNGQGIKRLGLFTDDEIAPELGQRADEPLVIAHRASVFFNTDLEVRLSAQGIDTLIMAGIASTGVVLSSVAYASDADFRLYTVKDCCYDPDQVVHEHLFSTAFESRTTVLSLADALPLLGGAPVQNR